MRTISILALLAGTASAEPEHVLATAGAGASTTEASGETTTAVGGIELELAGLAVSARGDLGDRRATVLVGIAPGRDGESHVWTPRCSASVVPATCQAAPRDSVPAPPVAHRVVPLAGVRRDGTRTAAVLAARLFLGLDPLGDHFELAVTGIIAGRDREFVQHARYLPGWYLAASWRLGPILVGGEVGATGLQTREMDGRVAPEMFALATLGVVVSR